MIPLAVSHNQLLERGVREGEGSGLVPGLVLEGEHAEDLARIAEAWPRLPQATRLAIICLLGTAPPTEGL